MPIACVYVCWFPGVAEVACRLATLGVTAKDVPAVRRRISDLEAKLADVRPAVGSATDRARLARKQKQLRAALVELAAADAALALVNEDHVQAVSRLPRRRRSPRPAAGLSFATGAADDTLCA